MNNRRFITNILMFFLFLGSIYGQDSKDIITQLNAQSTSRAILAQQFHHWEIYELDVNQLFNYVKSTNRPELNFHFDEQTIETKLSPVKLLSNDYDLVEINEQGRTSHRAGSALAFVDNQTDNQHRLTINKDFLYGYFSVENERFFIEPLWYFDNTQPKDLFVLYNTKDLNTDTEKTCGVTDMHRIASSTAPPQKATPESPLNDCYEVELAIASDYSMFQKYGSVTGVENHNLGVLNNVQGNYTGVFDWDFIFNVVTHLIISNSGGDPWSSSTDSGTLLQSFRQWGNNGGFGVNFDMAQLWSNRDFNGSTIGLAYIGVVCDNSSNYHILQDFSNNAELLRVMTAHEMGHNFDAVNSSGSSHDASGSNTIMAPTVSSATQWSQESIDDVNGYAGSLVGGCLPQISCSAASPPSANFTSIPVAGTAICVGSSVDFIDLSTGLPTSWFWEFQGGSPSTSTAQHPTNITYFSEGNFDVTLTVTNADGTTSATSSNHVIVQDQPNPDFTFSQNGLTLNFTNLTAPAANSYIWDFGDPASGANNTSTLTNPSHTYPQDGGYTVTLTALNNCGQATYVETISVNTPPTANFTADAPSGCTPHTINFTDLSSDNTTQWQWNFPGGTPSTSTAQNPTVVYHTPGVYNVELTAFSPGGSHTHTQTNYIFISQGHEPDFNFSVSGLTVNFTNTTSPLSGNTYSWTFGDGSNPSSDTHPTHTYAASGSYQVILNATNATCGTKADTQYVNLATPPVADFSTNPTPAADCAPFTVQFLDNSTNAPTSWQWTFPGGNPSSSTDQNPTVQYNSPGFYSATLAVTSAGGSDAITKTNIVEVQATPVASFSHSTSGGNLVSFTNTSSGNNNVYTWNFGDGSPQSNETNPQHQYMMDGTYSVILTVTNDCGTHTAFADVNITGNTPTASIIANPSSGCEPLTVTFTADVSANTQNVVWSFPGGNPTTSTSTTQTVTYANDGTYSVSLTAINGTNEVTATTSITVNPNPTVSFFTGTSGLTLTTTNNSGNGTSYLWDFGDGNQSTDFQPTHTYLADGTYNVCLTVTNDCNSEQSCQQVVLSGNAPTAAISANVVMGCEPLTVQFSATNITGNPSLSWSFPGGNPGTSTQSSVTVTYPNDGVYVASLTATNPSGNSTDNQQIIVNPIPDAGFSYSVSNGTTVSFTNTSTGNPTSYSWDFGDGSQSTEANPTHVYTSDGNFTACLTSINDCGQTTSCQTVTITGTIPTASIITDVDFGCTPLTVNFHANVANASSVSWVFPNGTPGTSTQIDQAVTFHSAGTHEVSLTATSNSGQSVTVTKNVTIQPLPVSLFDLNLSGYLLTTTNNATDAVNYFWDFGDGTQSTAFEPGHVYDLDSLVTVQFIVSNNCGSDTSYQQIQVGSLPTTNPTSSTTSICAGETVSFQANTSGNTDLVQWTFEGGNPGQSNNNNEVVTYQNPGTYTATVQVSNGLGTDTETIEVQVAPSPNAGFTQSFNNLEASFQNTSQHATNYNWNFGDGTPDSQEPNPTHAFPNPGTYTVTLTAFGPCGTDIYTILITAGSNLPPSVDIQSSGLEGCAPYDVQFSGNISGNPDTYGWEFQGGNPSTSTDMNPSVSYANPGTFMAILTATNSNGSDADTIYVHVLQPTIADFSVGTPSGKTVSFNSAPTQNATSYSWDFGDASGTSNDPNPTYTYANDGTYTVTLTVSGPCGTNTHNEEVTISTTVAPTVTISSDKIEGCDPLVVQFQADITGSADNIMWTFEGGDPSVSNDPNPIITFANPGTYTINLEASNSAGSGTDQQTVTVHPSASADFSFGSIQGLNVSFSNTSTDADSFEWDFDDGTFSSDENPSHTYASAGSYTIKLIASNTCSEDNISKNLLITNIEDPTGELILSLSPNPGNGIYNFGVEATKAEMISLTIYSVLGQQIFRKEWNQVNYINDIIDITEAPSGHYILKLNYGNRIIFGKLQKI